MSILRWLADYWYIPVLVVGALVGAVVLSRKGRHWSALRKIATELNAIGAKREVREVQLQLGAEQAKQHVKEKYAAKREALDAKAEAKAKELEHDPLALAKYLVRATDDGS